MKALILIAALSLVGAFPPCAGQDSSLVHRIETALTRIPTSASAEENENAFDSVLAVLYRHPALAAEVLVARLEPVAPGKHSETPRVVWYIRALRSLTGLDFKASTKARLTDDEKKHWGASAPFFTWDLGWDETWVAPKDAQVAIIHKWRAWFAREGKTFHYVNDRDHEHWYF